MKRTYRHKKFTAEFTDEGGYFALTGDVDGASGACGDRIAKIDERFGLLNALHLCDANTGAPMHAAENALYWAQNGEVDRLAAHLRITPEGAAAIIGRVAGAGVFGRRDGEQARSKELARFADLEARLARVEADGLTTVADMAREIKLINGDLRGGDEKVKLPNKEPLFWTGKQVYAAKRAMLDNLKRSRGIADTLPSKHALAEQKQSIENSLRPLWAVWKAQAQRVRVLAAQIPKDLTEATGGADAVGTYDFAECEDPGKVRALATWLKCAPADIEEQDELYFAAHGRQYLVATDDEADELWDEALDNDINECLLPELPESVQQYFDRDKWKGDARADGRGHALGRYDGEEHEVISLDATYYIYRV